MHLSPSRGRLGVSESEQAFPAIFSPCGVGWGGLGGKFFRFFRFFFLDPFFGQLIALYTKDTYLPPPSFSGHIITGFFLCWAQKEIRIPFRLQRGGTLASGVIPPLLRCLVGARGCRGGVGGPKLPYTKRHYRKVYLSPLFFIHFFQSFRVHGRIRRRLQRWNAKRIH